MNTNARPHDVLHRARAELGAAPALPGSERATILAVAAWAYEPLDTLGPADLAAIAGVSAKAMPERLRRLEAAGWVRYDRKAKVVTPGPRLQRQHEAVAR